MKAANLLFVALVYCGALIAQIPSSGVIEGTVTDASGAVVPNAEVTAEDLASESKTSVTANTSGSYRIAVPKNGTYRLTVTAKGFEKFTLQNVEVVGAQTRQFDAKLSVARNSETVEVNAGNEANAVTMGMLGVSTLQETPFSINIVTSDVYKNLQASNTQEALRYNPTINLGSGSNDLAFTFEIRGFQASAGSNNSAATSVDGIRSYARTDPIEDKERIEVLNGPNSFIYGISTPAGMINYVTKRPTLCPLRDVTTGTYGGKQAYIEGDFGGQFLKQLGYRLNLLYVDKGETGIKGQTHERFLTSAVIDWHPTSALLWSFDYSHYQRNIHHGDDLFTVASTVTSIPQAPDASTNYMAPYSAADDRFNRTGTNLDWKIGDGWTLRTGFRYTAMTSYRHRTSDALTNNTGSFTMTRNLYSMGATTYQGYGFINGDFRTGALRHTVRVGFTDDNSTTKYAYPYVNQNVTIGKYNLYQVNNYAADPSLATVGGPTRTTDITALPNVIISDQVRLGTRWSLLAGMTRAAVNDRSWNGSTGAESPQNKKSSVIPGVALSFTPISSITLYGSFMDGLQAGPTVASTYANANAVLSPYRSRQEEAGLKGKVGFSTLSVAFFHIQTANLYADPVTSIESENGQEVHKGVEFVSFNQITRSLKVNGGFTLLNAEVTKTATSSLLHKTPIAVPKQEVRLNAEYNVPKINHLVVSGGYLYTSKTWFDSANKLIVPSSSIGDLGARYEGLRKGKTVTAFRFNVTNIRNSNYWDNSGGSLSLGAPRTYACSGEIRF